MIRISSVEFLEGKGLDLKFSFGVGPGGPTNYERGPGRHTLKSVEQEVLTECSFLLHSYVIPSLSRLLGKFLDGGTRSVKERHGDKGVDILLFHLGRSSLPEQKKKEGQEEVPKVENVILSRHRVKDLRGKVVGRKEEEL